MAHGERVAEAGAAVLSAPPDPRIWQAAEALWEAAEQAGAEDIDAFLAARGEIDPEVLALFRRLWSPATPDGSSTSQRPTEQLDAVLRLGSMARGREGQTIGRFRLIDLLGEGGSGVVYLGEEEQDDLFHRVAVKLLHQHFEPDDDALRAASHERRLLARLSHPSITRYYESGLTDDGLFYVVVEHVHGLPITRHVREHGCSARETLRLFVQVVRAVHYAHQNLIVHRDLKPSNILVDAEHRLPKLLDFGIARDLEGRADDEHTVVFAYTPAYASPEQLSGLATIGTPTDLYSLGMVLHELVFGELPVSAGLGNPVARLALLRDLHVREVTAGQCALPVDGLHAAQRQDLTAVLRRLLSFHAEDRYPSAEALAEDLERILADRPIGHGHHSLRRRLGRLLRRHRALSAAAAAAVLVLIAGAAVYVMQAQHLARQAARLESVRAVLSDLLTRPDPLRRGSSVTLAETVKEMAPALAADDGIEPGVKAEVEAILGRSLLRLGEIQQATELLRSARDYLQSTHAPDAMLDDLDADLALAELEAGHYGEARDQAARQVDSLQARSRRDPLREARALRILATADIYADNDLDAAAAHATAALSTLEAARASDHAEATTVQTVLALALSLDGQLDRAESVQRAVLQKVESTYGRASGQSFDPRNNLARTLQKQGQFDAAEALLVDNAALAETLFGDDAPDTLMAQNNLALNFFRQQRYEQAVPLMRAVYAGRQRVLGAAHPRTSMAASNLADALIKVGDIDEACALSRAAESALRANAEAAPHLHGHPGKVHARCLVARGQLAEALTEVRAVVALWQERLGADHLDTLGVRQDEAIVLAALGELDAARAEIDEVIDRRTSRYGAEHPANLEARALRASWSSVAKPDR